MIIWGGDPVVDGRRCDENDVVVVVRVVTAAAFLLLLLLLLLLRPVLDRGRTFSSESGSIPFATATDRYFGWRRTGDGLSFL